MNSVFRHENRRKNQILKIFTDSVKLVKEKFPVYLYMKIFYYKIVIKIKKK